MRDWSKLEELFGNLECDGKSELITNYAELERGLGFSLPQSAYDHDEYWVKSNPETDGGHRAALHRSGWHKSELNRTAKTVTFEQD